MAHLTLWGEFQWLTLTYLLTREMVKSIIKTGQSFVLSDRVFVSRARAILQLSTVRFSENGHEIVSQFFFCGFQFWFGHKTSDEYLTSQ